MRFSILVELLVHFLEVVVGLGELLILTFEGEAGRTIFDTVLHLCYYHFELFYLSLEGVEVVVASICARVLFLLVNFMLIFVLEEGLYGCF